MPLVCPAYGEPNSRRLTAFAVVLFTASILGCDAPDEFKPPKTFEQVANIEYGERGNVQGVRIKFVKLSPKILSEIQAKSSLEVVEINECERDDSPILSEFNKLSQLRELTLNHVALADDELEQLANCSKLNSLELSQTGITGSGLKELCHLPLKRLALRGFTLTAEGLRHLSKFEQLEDLELFIPNLTATDLPAVSELKHLRKLSLQRLQFNYREYGGLEKIVQSKSLQRLEIGGSRLNKRVFDAIGRLPNVSHLVVSGSQINDEGLRALGQLKNLQVLRLDACGALTENAPTILSEFQQLREISLEGMTIKGTELKQLLRLPYLKRIDVRGVALDFDSARQFETLAKTSDISFSHGDGMDYMIRRGP